MSFPPFIWLSLSSFCLWYVTILCCLCLVSQGLGNRQGSPEQLVGLFFLPLKQHHCVWCAVIGPKLEVIIREQKSTKHRISSHVNFGNSIVVINFKELETDETLQHTWNNQEMNSESCFGNLSYRGHFGDSVIGWWFWSMSLGNVLWVGVHRFS